MASQVDAYGLLVEEFKSEDVTDQLAAARRIPIVATCMGPDRCVWFRLLAAATPPHSFKCLCPIPVYPTSALSQGRLATMPSPDAATSGAREFPLSPRKMMRNSSR